MQKTRNILNNVILSFCSAVMVIMVLAVVWQVFSRYVLNAPSTFTDELSRFCLIWSGMLGASYAFGKHAHLAITFAADKIEYKKYYYIEQAIYLITLLFFIVVMIYGGSKLSLKTMGQISPSLRLPMGVVYSILPISGIVNCCYSLLNIFEAAANKKNRLAGGVK